MSLNRARAQKYLQKFDFESLFIEELGWDMVDRVMLPFEIDGEFFEVISIAQKRGFTVFKCITTELPARPLRVKLDRQLTDYSKSHLLVFGDEGKTQQTWMWVRQELGKPLAPRFEQYQVGQTAERLLQKLEALAIAFAEEEKLTLVEVAQRVKKAFDVEKVTKKFFTRFEKEHGQFLKFIDGIQSEFDRTWYASLMLNRLMFVYFIQKKNFLDNDPAYLRNRLKRCQTEWGTDTFHSFYRQFLLKLFHEGLGKPGRDAELDKLLGKVPCLNGGLFEVHQLEEKYEETIQIPDAAFETVFNFFDEYDWHLDEACAPPSGGRPLRNQNEINPDVLGYIFEKYINQKQMGAYYTKEDITEYISKNTIIPFLFDAALAKAKGKRQKVKGDEVDDFFLFPFSLLLSSPDRYIYSAVRQGVDLELPAEIAAGIEDVAQRGGWNKPAAAGFALPTETWREHVARRQRCLDLRQKLAAGEVTQINDLITYNLDIRQFAQDVITSCESSDLLKALYGAIEQVSVIDPTCGSGAFLFAALNILEPLYTACLEQMQGLGDEDNARFSPHPLTPSPKGGEGEPDSSLAPLSRSGRGAGGEGKPRYEKFRTTLAKMAKHPNPRYFVLKSIMLNNLYGVDIMEEATEICKLRLFLKLVAQMEAQPKKENFGLEPLPDIDFNIRACNTLVGFASLDEVRKAITQDEVKSKKAKGKSVEVEADQFKLDLQDDASRIDEKAELADRAFQRFRQMQTDFGMNAVDFRDSKKELRRRLAELNDELNRYLAREYGVDADKPAVFEKWRESHQPFHWFIEFYSIIDRGGFDVIIGNPPYVEYSKIKSHYSIENYQTESCGNLYAYVIERSLNIIHSSGYSGMIIPLSTFCTQRMSEIWSYMSHIFNSHWISHYGFRPSKLFDGVNLRLAITLSGKQKESSQIKCYTSKLNKWNTEQRHTLLESLNFVRASSGVLAYKVIPKMSQDLENEIIDKIMRQPRKINDSAKQKTDFVVYYKNTGVNYWITATDFPPKAFRDNQPSSSSRQTEFSVNNDSEKDFILCILNSNLFFYFYTVKFNCGDLNPSDIKDIPIPAGIEKDEIFLNLASELMRSLDGNSEYITRDQKQTGSIKLQSFHPGSSKPIIDEIDRVLAQHYGFTVEELDDLISYGIKYRMGRDSES